MDISREDIQHLGTLARIRLSETEVESLKSDISHILDYVSAVNEIVADTALLKEVGPRHNVFREDRVTNPSRTHTDVLLAEMPERHGTHLKVKKILNPDS